MASNGAVLEDIVDVWGEDMSGESKLRYAWDVVACIKYQIVSWRVYIPVRISGVVVVMVAHLHRR